MLSATLLDALASHTSLSGSLKSIIPVNGGSINQSYRLEASSASFFLKVNGSRLYREMFAKEAESFLLLEWIEYERNMGSGQAMLGWQLAAFHKHSS